MRAVAALILASVTIRAAPAHAAEPITRDRRVAAGVSVVPGVAIHGAGHYALGHRKTALALLISEGIGLALLIGGVSTELASGNSRKLAGPALAATVLGSGLVLASFGADLYGTLNSEGGAVDLLPRAPPRHWKIPLR